MSKNYCCKRILRKSIHEGVQSWFPFSYFCTNHTFIYIPANLSDHNKEDFPVLLGLNILNEKMWGDNFPHFKRKKIFTKISKKTDELHLAITTSRKS